MALIQGHSFYSEAYSVLESCIALLACGMFMIHGWPFIQSLVRWLLVTGAVDAGDGQSSRVEGIPTQTDGTVMLAGSVGM